MILKTHFLTWKATTSLYSWTRIKNYFPKKFSCDLELKDYTFLYWIDNIGSLMMDLMDGYLNLEIYAKVNKNYCVPERNNF